MRVPFLFLLLLGAGAREDVLTRLHALNRSEQFLFGVEHGTLWGMFHDGQIVTTNEWFNKTVRAGQWSSDAAAITGDDPAVLGISADMLAFEPEAWNRRALVAEAMRRQLQAGGLVTIDWHAPACGAKHFYAEDDYNAPIKTRGDVPESLKCVCQIANGDHTWLLAQARQLANVIKSEKLGDEALIFRPFHEQNGAWFWWGSPYWQCEALLGKPGALSGANAYNAMVRVFIEAIRAELPHALFAYSPADLEIEKESGSSDAMALARGILRARMIKEMRALGLINTANQNYMSAYPGDDVIDIFGIDLYFPGSRKATAKDRAKFERQLRTVASEARARGKPYALTEVGTARLSTPGKPSTDAALARLFDPNDRRKLLKQLRPAATVSKEDWYTTQLLPLAKASKVAYAMVWATYISEEGGSFFVPYPGHPEAESFKRFYTDPATLFLKDH
jgi:hypothetical protein